MSMGVISALIAVAFVIGLAFLFFRVVRMVAKKSNH